MTISITQIDTGEQANDGTGTPLRDAFQIINSNFASIETVVNSGDLDVITANLISTGSLVVNNSASIGQITVGSGLVTGSLTAGGFNGNLNGVATAATKLQAPRLINGQQFDGTQDIIINIDNYTIDGGSF